MGNKANIVRSLALLGLAAPFVAGPAHAQTDITAFGTNALMSNTTGDYNVAMGVNALRTNTTGSQNTAHGRGALYKNVSGNYNTAVGLSALYWTTGSDNTAVGSEALPQNTSGNGNTAVGSGALYSNTTGEQNVALGIGALYGNVSESSNTAVGFIALAGRGWSNTAIGSVALGSNQTGNYNTAVGSGALLLSTTGESNVAIGYDSMLNNTAGESNVAIGWRSMSSNTLGDGNTAVGRSAGAGLVGGSNNTFVGYLSGLTSCSACGNSGAFGYNATATAANTIRIGNNSITQIGGIVGWSNLSDRRNKTNIKANVPGLEFIAKLKPVTFNWELSKLNEGDGVEKFASDPVLGEAREAKAKKVYTGFIAQDVEAAAEECGFDFSGVVKPANENSSYHLTYAEFVVPLVKAVQEQQKEIDELRETVRALALGNQLRDGRLGKGADQSHSQHAATLGTWGGAMTLLGAAMALLHLKRRTASGKPTS